MYANRKLSLYIYLTGSYLKFLVLGKCLEFPRIVQIQTQSFCNGSCSICPYPAVSKELDQGEMEWELFMKIINESARESLLSQFLLELHNEPLLDTEIFERIKYIKSISPDKSCVVITNGELLDSYRLEDIAQSNLDKLIISLNAYSKEIYQTTNNGLNYEKVFKNVSRLLSNPSMRHKVTLAFVLTKQNEHDVYKAVQYWTEKGIKTRVTGLTNRAGTLNNFQKISLDNDHNGNPLFSRVWRRMMSAVRGLTGCELLFKNLCILFNGDVIICCHDWKRATVVGNVRLSSLKDIWNSPETNALRKLIVRKRYKNIQSCRDCSIVA
ncbi:radical SAM/SPASM domain-containing protein [Chloroflexota bacterium]